MDSPTLVLLCGLISCIIGIATFVASMVSKAKKDGILEQKINQALKGIEEIKTELKTANVNQNSLALTVRSHEEKITSNTDKIKDLEGRLDIGKEIRDALQGIGDMMKRG